MSYDTENFDQLRRLLALKRHEQPPPGYYNDFSHQVILRIKTGERERGNILERLFGEAPWVQEMLAAFQSKPALAAVTGVAFCGLLIAGVLYSDKTEAPPVALVPPMETALATQPTVSAADHPLFAKPVALEPSSTSPITATPSDQLLLGDMAKLPAQRASWSFPGGGN